MKNSKSFIGLIILLTLSLNIVGQQTSESFLNQDIFSKIQERDYEKGEIVIFQDMRINDLVYNHIEQNKRRGGVSGYRIHIFSNLGSSARGQSQATKARFYELFPEIPIYLEYKSPYYKVYVGDFRTKVDALKDFKRIKRYFPSAYIVPDRIGLPELDE